MRWDDLELLALINDLEQAEPRSRRCATATTDGNLMQRTPCGSLGTTGSSATSGLGQRGVVGRRRPADDGGLPPTSAENPSEGRLRGVETVQVR
jgi:hypothetical protein